LADHGDDAATFKALTNDYFWYCQADPAPAAKVGRALPLKAPSQHANKKPQES
jgi:hypothetical protein